MSYPPVRCTAYKAAAQPLSSAREQSADGFSLALGRWDGEARLPAFLHHGFRAESPEEVHAARFRAEGLEIVEESDEAGYVSVKTRDPSGYVVEVAWEA